MVLSRLLPDSRLLTNWSALFLSLVVIFMPFSYELIPPFAASLADVLQEHVMVIGHMLMGYCPTCVWRIGSDTHGLLLYIACIVPLALIVQLILRRLKTFERSKLMAYLQLFLLVYLSMQLARYGLSKIMLKQFVSPSANLLFSPIGLMDKDMLYWSAMSTSKFFSIASGLLELITAVMLLIKRTRIIGLLFAILIMAHVLFINISFDIDVKSYALLLLLIALHLSWPVLSTLTKGFLRGRMQLEFTSYSPIWARRLKPLVLILILAELAGGLVREHYAPPLSRLDKLGEAYFVEEAIPEIRRVFFHKQGYVITQNDLGHMTSHQINGSVNDSLFYLVDSGMLSIHPKEKGRLDAFLQLNGEEYSLSLLPIPIKAMPLKKDELKWTVSRR